MWINEMEDYQKEHPNEEVLCGAPGIHSGIGLGLKSGRNDETFKEKLRQIDKAHPGNTLSNYTKV